MIAAIVVDIEGTTSPTSSVREGLYDYTRAHLAQWLADNVGGDADPVIAETRALAGRPDAGPADVAKILCDWLNSDVKAEPLKAAQGLICAEGFRSGELHGEFFDDVPAALQAWHRAGVVLHVFSSGSVRNQQDWFAYARGGELASLISGWFDLTIAGPKRESSSYRTISEAIGAAGDEILFLSDHPDELDAAAAAGWSVLGVHRPGEPNSPRPPHQWIETFTDADLPIS
ncbi:acireductone synthase [Mycobacterium cookii]|uniref:Enolase-phosphatase E1 n=1 Tax=Mycobacterium cookii TaxID=1775 RepID=A0A7I7KUK3_9MYCO|nr:acireductone synthase [Mycobacterium cookii]MCV7328750.1 acireductone synthase [Mycobacterium cookii]BBX45376.1 enolase-phosphatase E1 [Mycobacterium cookii]